MKKRYLSFALLCLVSAVSFGGILDSLPVNTWVRIASSPGDPRGREVAPGRCATWTYEPNVKKFFRYGGTTPSYSNALYSFDPVSLTWAVVRPFDETYPANRPGGGTNWTLAYDSVRKAIWITNGWRSTYSTGDMGVWLYDAVNDTFKRVANSGLLSYGAYDPDHDLILSSPVTNTWPYNLTTQFFSPATGQWTVKPATISPSARWEHNFPVIYDRSVGKFVLFKSTSVWTFDPVAKEWAVLDSIAAGGIVSFPAIAYDPLHEVAFIYGGLTSPDSTVNKTLIYNAKTKTLTKLNVPGLPGISHAVYIPQALAWDPLHKCMLMNEPDLGVWAFKYDPASPMGTTALNSEAIVIGKAPANPPAPGRTEAPLRSFPTPLNQKILDMADNSVIQVSADGGTGGEIMWDYDPDAGVLIRYGGCGNSSGSYWGGYGNQLELYDPGTGMVYCRRTLEGAGVNRPRGSCTRSTIYDTRRKEWHFFGGVGSGPIMPPPGSTSYAYNVAKDSFTAFPSEQPSPTGNMGTFLCYDSIHDITILPDSGKTYVFHFETGIWETRITAVSPGTMNNMKTSYYYRSAFMTNVGKFITLKNKITGTDSVMETWTYDPAANLWENVNSTVRPTYRGCNYGLAYDSKNGVVLLVAGQKSWNSTPVNDMWIYHPVEKTWEEMKPPAVAGFPIANGFALTTAYDSRHNAFIMTAGPWTGSHYPVMAYRYKRAATAAEQPGERKNDILLTSSPNPFNLESAIKVYLPDRMQVKLEVFNVDGRMIRVIASDMLAKGEHRFIWNGKDLNSRTVAEGVYYLRVTAGNKERFEKIVYQR
ncbi:MAG: T9SS type A sorting domain-containing protein [Fibrobacteres bacterium]|nr:T9SS type A sorting domain-containing protein [Fibrobacterota bacterium]